MYLRLYVCTGQAVLFGNGERMRTMRRNAARLAAVVMALGSMTAYGAVSSFAEQPLAVIAESETLEARTFEDAATVSVIKAISECNIEADSSACVYSGQKQYAAVTIKDGDKTLVKGTDYSLAYANCVNPGTATIIITGKGSYTGGCTVRYTIAKAALSTCTVSGLNASYNYTGSAIVPDATLTNAAGKTLIKDTDYTVSCKNNTAIGTATITFTGKGKYTGSLSRMFEIKTPTLANVTGMTATSVGTNSVTLQWNKVSGAQGYVVYLYDKAAKKWKRYKKTETAANTITVTGLNAGEAYAFTARAYTMSGTKEILSPSFTNYKVATAPAKVNFTITARQKGKAVLNWTKVAGATSYAVYYKPNGGSWSKIATVNNSTTSYTYTKVRSGDTGYMTVRAFKNYEGVIRGGTSVYTKAIYKYPLAAKKLDSVGWDLYSAYCASAVTWKDPNGEIPRTADVTMEWYANYGFTKGYGHCFNMAAMFAEMAKTLGYDCTMVWGYVPMRAGGMGIHSWCEVKQNGKVYVCDSDFKVDAGFDCYMREYYHGTWNLQKKGNVKTNG